MYHFLFKRLNKTIIIVLVLLVNRKAVRRAAVFWCVVSSARWRKHTRLPHHISWSPTVIYYVQYESDNYFKSHLYPLVWSISELLLLKLRFTLTLSGVGNVLTSRTPKKRPLVINIKITIRIYFVGEKCCFLGRLHSLAEYINIFQWFGWLAQSLKVSNAMWRLLGAIFLLVRDSLGSRIVGLYGLKDNKNVLLNTLFGLRL